MLHLHLVAQVVQEGPKDSKKILRMIDLAVNASYQVADGEIPHFLRLKADEEVIHPVSRSAQCELFVPPVERRNSSGSTEGSIELVPSHLLAISLPSGFQDDSIHVI